MNTKRCFLLFSAFISLNIHTQDYQDLENTLRNLCAPVKTTSTGFSDFLRDTFNKDEYAHEVLPNNLNHIIQFLDHGKNSKQTRAYAQSVLRLFTLKLKGSAYVNAQAFNLFLEELPALLESYFLVQRSQNLYLLQEKINNLLYTRFLEKFSMFKSSPSAFFNDLSLEIAESLGSETTDPEVSMEELRKTILIFLEVSLSKLIWSPEEHIETWKSVKSISDNLTALMDCNIIADPDDLNGLFVTLLERYSFFIDIASDDLPSTFYEEIKHDINSASLLLFEQEELEPLIESKRDRFKRALEMAQAHKK